MLINNVNSFAFIDGVRPAGRAVCSNTFLRREFILFPRAAAGYHVHWRLALKKSRIDAPSVGVYSKGRNPLVIKMNMRIWHGIWFVVVAVCMSGCAHSSWETGNRDRDIPEYYEDRADDQPASLFEMSFGGGESEVTKNLPADAADKVGEAVKTLRGKPPKDVTGE